MINGVTQRKNTFYLILNPRQYPGTLQIMQLIDFIDHAYIGHAHLVPYEVYCACSLTSFELLHMLKLHASSTKLMSFMIMDLKRS